MAYWECTECGTTHPGELKRLRRTEPTECETCGGTEFTQLEADETELPDFDLDTFVNLTLMIIGVSLIGWILGVFLGASGSRIIMSMGVTIPLVGGIGYGVSRHSRIAWTAGVGVFVGSVVLGFLLLTEAFAFLSAGATPFPTVAQIVFGISYATLGSAALWMLVAGREEIW